MRKIWLDSEDEAKDKVNIITHSRIDKG